MNKHITMLLICTVLVGSIFLCGCGDPKTINGVRYNTYGFINADSEKSSQVEYRVIYGNVIWSIILCNTIVAPVYFLGFDLYEPIGLKQQQNSTKGE